MPDRRRFIQVGGLLVSLGHPRLGASAGALLEPQEQVILEVTGAIVRSNRPGAAAFDRPMLEGLGPHNLATWTPWTEGLIEFHGVLARRLMAEVGAGGQEVLASALNDYSTVIPISDFESYDVLLATRREGAPLAVRDKGPVWVIYPWADHPELDDMVTRRKSVWQLSRLHVR